MSSNLDDRARETAELGIALFRIRALDVDVYGVQRSRAEGQAVGIVDLVDPAFGQGDVGMTFKPIDLDV
jgi:hypothetical protein